jgi:citrate lyase subunit beta/citryl-CoA lyase
MGFAGKQAIHPAQVAIINEAFTPDPDELREAKAVIDAFEKEGAAVVRVDGEMADSPHLLRARRLIRLADRIEESTRRGKVS